MQIQASQLTLEARANELLAICYAMQDAGKEETESYRLYIERFKRIESLLNSQLA
jgi:hypothetical protein